MHLKSFLNVERSIDEISVEVRQIVLDQPRLTQIFFRGLDARFGRQPYDHGIGRILYNGQADDIGRNGDPGAHEQRLGLEFVECAWDGQFVDRDRGGVILEIGFSGGPGFDELAPVQKTVDLDDLHSSFSLPADMKS